MSPLFGLSHAFLVILAASGSLKLLQPTATIDAMHAARLFRLTQRPMAAVAARMIGFTEVGLVVWALVTGSPYALSSAALLFLAFNLFLWRLARQDASASCGCLGMATSASNPVHRIVNWVAASCLFAGSAAVTFGWSGASVSQTLRLDRPTATAYWVAVAILAWLTAALPTLPDLRPGQETSPA